MPKKKELTPPEKFALWRTLPVDSPERQEVIDSLTDEDKAFLETYFAEGERGIKAEIAKQEDTPDGFACFYELVHGNELPDHCREWVEHIYGAKRKDKGVLNFAWRGSWKTTTISVTFTAWRIGKDPERANLIIQANDKKAAKTTQLIADIIKTSPAWKMVFPNIVPDMERGWGAGGYEVKRNDIEYPEWREMNSSRVDDTLLGLGIESGSLIGKHPDGVLNMDDIHDEENTVSVRERQNIINKVTSTILPFVVEDEEKPEGERMVTWFLVVGTPWTDDDAYHYLKDTGEFEFIEIPVMTAAEEGEEGAVRIDQSNMTVANHTDIYGWWKLNWPKKFGIRTIVVWRNRTGKREFARMYLLDLSVAKETGLKYLLYPSESIDLNWVAGGGVDYASTIEIRGKKMDLSQRSRFAMTYGLKTPMNRAVIYDGISGHFSQVQAEGYVERAQEMFYNWHNSGVEMDGKGEELYALLGRKPHVRLFPFWTGGKSKRNRQERVLGPWLELGVVMISDADTDFLTRLRKALDDWPNGNMDEIDSVYAYCKTIPDVLRVPKQEEGLPAPRKKEKEPSPFVAFGRK
jgi:hypothetical protein